ncbi:hypothetical protein ACFL17_01995 [Pseudomonadota bacterium]
MNCIDLELVQGNLEFFRLDRHRQGLPLYHHNYQARVNRLKLRLKWLPDLRLHSNFVDGISVRGHANKAAILANSISASIIQDKHVANNIVSRINKQSDLNVRNSKTMASGIVS